MMTMSFVEATQSLHFSTRSNPVVNISAMRNEHIKRYQTLITGLRTDANGNADAIGAVCGCSWRHGLERCKRVGWEDGKTSECVSFSAEFSGHVKKRAVIDSLSQNEEMDNHSVV